MKDEGICVMDWKVKLIGEKICSFMPFGYKLASTARNKLVNTEVDCLERIDKGLDNLAMIRKLTGFDPENKKILEVGTGRHGIDCLILYVLGATFFPISGLLCVIPITLRTE